jgi:ribonuclease HI
VPLPKWQQSDWKINGKDIWSREDWMAIAEASKNIKIYATHMDAHTSKTDPPHPHNDKADKLAALMTSKLTISNKAPWKVTNTSDETKVTLQYLKLN